MPVHLYGQFADMDRIYRDRPQHNLAVIEDAAQAVGAECKAPRRVRTAHGTFRSFRRRTCPPSAKGGWSPTTVLAAKPGLCATTARSTYYHNLVGGNFRLDALQAAILRVKLPRLAAWTAGRRRNAERYRRLFAEAELREVVSADDERHIYNQFVIRAPRRDAVVAHSCTNGRSRAAKHRPPRAAAPAGVFLRAWAIAPGDLPARERGTRHAETLALPIYPELTEEMQAAVATAIAEAYA